MCASPLNSNGIAVIDSPIGHIKIRVESDCVVEIRETTFPLKAPEGFLADVCALITGYFNGHSIDGRADLFRLDGTPFQKAVWEECRRIPPGETRTYGEIAAAIGRPKAARAVAQALASNNLLFYIPCHRVVSASGLGGFRLGTNAKKTLLILEKTLKNTTI